MSESRKIGYRLRGVILPTESSIKNLQDTEHERRAILLAKLARTLFSYWYEFASKQISGVPYPDDLDAMYLVYLNCQCTYLWQFKNARKSDDKVKKYWHGIRVVVWDKNLSLWKEISKCYAAINTDHYYDLLCGLAHSIGMLSREMELFAKDQLNAAEYVMHQKISTQRGADLRHVENRAMKQDVFVWLDANMHRFRSMDAAAEAIAGQVVPMTFRTVRDWVGEWRKLRSAGKP